MNTHVDTPAPRELTKNEELAILREAARQLGPLSYCGPWLTQQIQFVESAIRSDFFPDVDINKTRELCANEARRCESMCADKLAVTEKTCAAMLARADKDARDVRHGVAAAIHSAHRAIASW